MRRSFTLEYWIDDSWYVGRLREVPGAFSQGETLEDLMDNVRDAYLMLMSTNDDEPSRADVQTIELELES